MHAGGGGGGGGCLFFTNHKLINNWIRHMLKCDLQQIAVRLQESGKATKFLWLDRFCFLGLFGGGGVSNFFGNLLNIMASSA